MKTQNSIYAALPVLFGFFVMGFCDIVGISSDYVQRTFNWSPVMTGFVPSLVFIWFLFLGIPVGNQMNKWGRKNTVLLSMGITVVGMLLPLVVYNSATCMIAYALLGIGNAILQVSLNPLLSNVVTSQRLLTSSLTAGQVIKAVSSLVGPEIVLLAVAHFGDDKWYYCFPILGFITLLSAIWLMATPVKREASSAATQQLSISDTFSLLKDKTILLLFLGIFFIVGVDVATNFISSKLMAERFDWTAEQVKFAPQVYFLSRTVGALLGAFLLARIAEMKYFRVNIVACIFSLLILAFVKNDMVNLIVSVLSASLPHPYFLSLFDGFTGKAGKSKPNFRIDDYCCCRWRSSYPGDWVCNRNSRCYWRRFCYFSLCVLFDLLCFWGEDRESVVLLRRRCYLRPNPT